MWPVRPGAAVRCKSFTRRSLAAAAPLLLAWALLQAADLAGDRTRRPRRAGPPCSTRCYTRGSATCCWRNCALVLLALIVGRAMAGSGRCHSRRARCLLQAGHSHAWSMEDGPNLLVASDCVHLLAAGAWLGGLLPLLLVVRGTPPLVGALAARWFSPLGKACVVGPGGVRGIPVLGVGGRPARPGRYALWLGYQREAGPARHPVRLCRREPLPTRPRHAAGLLGAGQPCPGPRHRGADWVRVGHRVRRRAAVATAAGAA